MDTAEILQHLQRVGIFADVSAETLSLLAENTTQRVYTVGECVIKQDDIPLVTFILLRGRLTLKLRDYHENPAGVIGSISPSYSLLNEVGILGEITWRRDIPQVEAVEESEVLEITRLAFGQFLSAAPDALKIICRTIARIPEKHSYWSVRAGIPPSEEIQTAKSAEAYVADSHAIEAFLIDKWTRFYGLGEQSNSEEVQAAGESRFSGLLRRLRQWANWR